MRATGARLAGQAHCAGDELETESLLHQLSNTEIYVGLSTAKGDFLTVRNSDNPNSTLNSIAGNCAKNTIIKIHNKNPL